ncbi:LemA family protein [Kordiimonas aestuarii]|uniref:LemA family protein n=1 Tax=Kordiimonas aestuarii TaxID=1005925 RepID=UPI0021D29938|nr:LemA family protein [Kordiimonas aestuarii]
MTAIYIILGLLVLFVLYGIGIYNKLVGLRVRKNEAWSDISVQMKRRYDLVPNLVETVKGYASHEKETLSRVIEARAAAVASTGSPGEQAVSENMFSQALGRLMAVSEAYPDLKADSNFNNLSRELSALEDHIQKSRRFYNGNVRELNTAVQEFPSNVVANMFGFTRAEFFELDEAEEAAVKTAPKVQF